MTTKLDKAIKREIEFSGVAYTVTLSPDGLKIVEKGKRLGQEHKWNDLIGGGLQMTRNLKESIAGGTEEESED